MTKTKATNEGCCQLCGRRQKLPGGVLAQHGYNVEWNQFVGVCPGSGFLPYELDRALIPPRIEWAEASIALMRASAATLRQPATEEKGWFKLYVRKGYLRGTYAWTLVQLIRTGTGDVHLHDEHLIESDLLLSQYAGAPQTHDYRFNPPHVLPLLDIATAMNKLRADAVAEEAVQLGHYLRYLTSRFNSWKLQPLLPLVDAVIVASERRVERNAERATKRLEMLRKKAERATKLVAKFEKLVPIEVRNNLKGVEFRSLDPDYALPYLVRNLLHDDWQRANGERPFDADPRESIRLYEKESR